jgi:hypothetical protein
MHIILIKTLSGWANGDENAEKLHLSVKLGSSIHGDFSRMRDAAFHRKLFALFQLAFEYFEPPEIDTKWGKPEKHFDTFRKNVTILAGYGHPVFNIDGTFKMEADSLSFGSMDQDTFNELYQRILDVLMKRIPMLSRMTREEIDDLTNKILAFT